MSAVYTDSAEDPMSEVLSEFVGDVVGIVTKDGKKRYGVLETSDGDNYTLRDLTYNERVVLEFHRDDALSLTAP